MTYTFTESDITALGVTDDTIKSLLLITSIVDSSYDDGLEMYTAYMKPNFHCLGGVDVRHNTNKSTIVSLMTKNERTQITVYNGNVRIGSEDLTGYETYDITYTISTIGSGGGYSNAGSASLTTLTDVTHLYVKGKSNIFGVIYDGDKTLTYEDKSINIDVYDDNGLTLKGQKGVIGIIYNGQRVNSVVLNGVSHILNDKIDCGNGIYLPKPPNQKGLYGDNKNHWLIRDNNSTGYYDLLYASYGFGCYNNTVYQVSNSKLQSGYGTRWYRISKTNPTDYWVHNKESTGGFTIDDTILMLASSDDVMTYSSMSAVTSDVYFAKTHDN